MARDPKTLITPEGQKALIDELNLLWREERPRVTEEVRVAAAHGDRSENAEYKYGKQRLREIDRRLRFLKKRLSSLHVQSPPQDHQNRVHFGSWVRVFDHGTDKQALYQIVGTDEVDPDRGKISVLSPVGRALLGKSLHDDLELKTPKGWLELTIEAISSDPPPDEV